MNNELESLFNKKTENMSIEELYAYKKELNECIQNSDKYTKVKTKKVIYWVLGIVTAPIVAFSAVSIMIFMSFGFSAVLPYVCGCAGGLGAYLTGFGIWNKAKKNSKELRDRCFGKINEIEQKINELDLQESKKLELLKEQLKKKEKTNDASKTNNYIKPTDELTR